MQTLTSLFLAFIVTALTVLVSNHSEAKSGEKAMNSKIEIYFSTIETWKKKDIEGVVANMKDDVVWHTVAAIDPPLLGKAAAREFLKKYGGALKNSRWRVISYAETDTQLFVEGIEEFDTVDDTHNILPYSGIYDFRDDKISGWRDYFDRGLSNRLKEGQAIPNFVQALADRRALQAGQK